MTDFSHDNLLDLYYHAMALDHLYLHGEDIDDAPLTVQKPYVPRTLMTLTEDVLNVVREMADTSVYLSE